MSSREQTVLIGKLRNFFKEFDFSGSTSIRFYNTLYFMAKENRARQYVLDYFKLIDSPYVDDVREKLKSKEFKLLMDELKEFEKPKRINNRFRLYYGNQGGGKTTKAKKEFPDAKVIVCNSSFEPEDLLEDFTFVDGKPTYKYSPLLLAMIWGNKVILDEINLLPRSCLRYIQGFLDNKNEFVYKGDRIIIREGFEIIGTMNLEVNGQIEEVPSPLVDRAYDIIEVIPTDEFIAEMAFKNESNI